MSSPLSESLYPVINGASNFIIAEEVRRIYINTSRMIICRTISFDLYSRMWIGGLEVDQLLKTTCEDK